METVSKILILTVMYCSVAITHMGGYYTHRYGVHKREKNIYDTQFKAPYRIGIVSGLLLT